MHGRSRSARAAGVLTWRVIPWLAGIPAVSACSISNISSCLSSPPTTVIVVIAVVGSLVVLSIILAVSCRVRRFRRAERARLARRSSIPRFPLPLHMVYQAHNPPILPTPVHKPQPQHQRGQSDGSEHRQSNSRSQYSHMPYPTPVSMPIPEPISTAPAAPVPSVRARPPSGVPVSRPISTLDTRPFSIRSSTYAYDTERITVLPPSSPVRDPSTSVHQVPPQPIVVRRESREPLHTTSPAVSSPTSASPRLLSPTDTPAPPPIRPFALAPMHTGASIANNDDPPPAYTPI